MSGIFNAQNIAFLGFIAISIILLGFAAMVLWKIYNNDIGLEGLLAEPAPVDKPDAALKASLSRFQFLLFTFVIAGLYLLLSIEAGTFVDIPANVLVLLGISSGSYVVAKTMGGGSSDKKPPPARKRSPAASGDGS